MLTSVNNCSHAKFDAFKNNLNSLKRPVHYFLILNVVEQLTKVIINEIILKGYIFVSILVILVTSKMTKTISSSIYSKIKLPYLRGLFLVRELWVRKWMCTTWNDHKKMITSPTLIHDGCRLHILTNIAMLFQHTLSMSWKEMINCYILNNYAWDI